MAKKRVKEEYSYCRLSKTKYLILKRVTGMMKAWNKIAEAINEPNAKQIVDSLNN